MKELPCLFESTKTISSLRKNHNATIFCTFYHLHLRLERKEGVWHLCKISSIIHVLGHLWIGISDMLYYTWIVMLHYLSLLKTDHESLDNAILELWLAQPSLYMILISCSSNMVTVLVYSKLKTSWKPVVLTNKVGKNSWHFVGVFNTTIIPRVRVGYEMVDS